MGYVAFGIFPCWKGEEEEDSEHETFPSMNGSTNWMIDLLVWHLSPLYLRQEMTCFRSKPRLSMRNVTHARCEITQRKLEGVLLCWVFEVSERNIHSWGWVSNLYVFVVNSWTNFALWFLYGLIWSGSFACTWNFGQFGFRLACLGEKTKPLNGIGYPLLSLIYLVS